MSQGGQKGGESGGEGERQSPIIKRPDNPELVRRLMAKLAVYRERIAQENKAEARLAPEMRTHDTRYKVAVLAAVLEHGSVNTFDLSRRLAVTEGGVYDSTIFNRACFVINDYCTTGGERVKGGKL